MQRIVLLLALIISTIIGMAQVKDEKSSSTKKEKRKARLEKEYQLTRDMLLNRDFVLEANFLQDRYGHRVPVSAGLNFVAVDSTEAIIQIGSNYSLGANGVGGVTAKGNITQWELKENKKKNTFNLRISVMTAIGIYDVALSISPYGKATANLTGLSAGMLTFDGDMVPWEESIVYVGRSL